MNLFHDELGGLKGVEETYREKREALPPLVPMG